MNIIKILAILLILLQLVSINIDIIRNIKNSRYIMAIIDGILVICITRSLLKILILYYKGAIL